MNRRVYRLLKSVESFMYIHITEHKRVKGSCNCMYTSNSQHDQIYRMRSWLIIIIAAFLRFNTKIISSRKKKDISDGTRHVDKLREDFLEGSYRYQE